MIRARMKLAVLALMALLRAPGWVQAYAPGQSGVGGGNGHSLADNLYHMKARYYDAEAKRFLSDDPIGLDGGNNLYLYADANPLFFIDPLGLWTFGIGMSVSGQLPLGSEFPLFVRPGGVAGFSVQFGWSREAGFSVGILGSRSKGPSVGTPGAAATFDISWSGNADVRDLKGPGVEVGVSGGAFGLVGGVSVSGKDINEAVPQNLRTFSFGIGTPGGEGHVYQVRTGGLLANDLAAGNGVTAVSRPLLVNPAPYGFGQTPAVPGMQSSPAK